MSKEVKGIVITIIGTEGNSEETWETADTYKGEFEADSQIVKEFIDYVNKFPQKLVSPVEHVETL